MSAETKQALEEAIAAHVTDEMSDGNTRFVTEYLVVCASAVMEKPEITSYFTVYTTNMPWHHASGLHDVLGEDIESNWGRTDDE